MFAVDVLPRRHREHRGFTEKRRLTHYEGGTRVEPVAAVYSQARRYVAVDGCDPARGHRRVSPTASLCVTGSRLSDDSSHHVLPGRESRRRGVRDHSSARTTVWTSAWTEPDD